MELPYYAFVIIVVLLLIIFLNWENSKSEKRASDRKFQEDREKNIELDFTKKRNEKLIERNEELEKQIKDSKK